MKITRARMAGGAAATTAAAVLVPAAAAVAFISPPLVLLGEPQSPAYLVAGGASVDATVEISCTADSMPVQVTLTEKVGKKIASGTGGTSISCDGATHRIVVRVKASPQGVAFAAGTANATVEVYGCRTRKDRTMCGSDVVERTIRLRK
jgi:hypothetical protein